jgi:hypothetical protein
MREHMPVGTSLYVLPTLFQTPLLISPSKYLPGALPRAPSHVAFRALSAFFTGTSSNTKTAFGSKFLKVSFSIITSWLPLAIQQPLTATRFGYVSTTTDALILFEAWLAGKLHHIQRRPTTGSARSSSTEATSSSMRNTHLASKDGQMVSTGAPAEYSAISLSTVSLRKHSRLVRRRRS